MCSILKHALENVDSSTGQSKGRGERVKHAISLVMPCVVALSSQVD